ncbi:MAG: serine/threonine protein kinase, partial [Candidatus Hydrogenedentes bacterium]|nr:serine/threonine protein kinase [Candidatus Hydrogenedentota bacterium]
MKRDDRTDERPFLKSRPELFDTIMAAEAGATPVNQAALPTLLIGNAVVDLEEAWAIGYRLDDHFEIKEIRGGKGVSGMGIVFIVEDDHGRRYAVKTLQRRFRQELHLVQRFVREARTWMLIGVHPNIVCAQRLDIIEAVPCLFMEFVSSDAEGSHALSQRLNHGPLNAAQVLDLTHQFCAGMIHATRAVPGLVHRDIKPENLLLAPDGTLKITDFGLVRTKAMSDDTLEKLSQSDFFEDLPKELTRVGSIFGTPAYMAPEQFSRASGVTFCADVYALGCCLFEALTGLPPFLVQGESTVERLLSMKRQHLNAEPPSIHEAVGSACPPALERIIRRCLAKRPGDRWESYQDLSIAVLSVMDTLGIEPRDVVRPDPSPREVAEQMRSLTLLEGYDQAIHMRKLREGQEASPYAFHLALASYFHCADDAAEEERQLSKALSLKATHAGSESVRRLTELWIRQGHHARAEVVLKAYLATTPDALEQVLEPVVRVACGLGDFEAALETLAPFGDTFRTRLLRTEIYRARGDTGALGTLLQKMHGTLLDRLRDKIEHLEATDTAGWSRADDPVLLETVLASLLP